MAIETYQFLSEQNVSTLVNQLFSKTNLRLDERIVNTLDESSSDKQVLSAIALYNILQSLNNNDSTINSRLDNYQVTLEGYTQNITDLNNSQTAQDEKLAEVERVLENTNNNVSALTHLTIETVTGSIETITEPKTDVMYLQRDDENDTTWMIYIYTEANGWVNIGDTEVDLSHLWSKDETEELKEALGIHDAEAIPHEDIINLVDQAFNDNTVDYRMEPEGNITISSIEYGTKLSDVEIKGTMMYDGVEVPGTFTWETTDEEFDQMINS